jgi:Fe-S-cluster containining protein
MWYIGQEITHCICQKDLKPMDFDSIKESIPHASPVQPQELRLDGAFQFDCHEGVSCFNQCCRTSDIQLLPYDILRLKQRMNMISSEFVSRYTVPFEMDHHGMPGLKLGNKPASNECVFLEENGCSVYEDRPTACRYYALGSMGVHKEGSDNVDNVYFTVKEDHCLGHKEPKQQTVAEYRKSQGVEIYDVMNEGWRDIVIQKRSSGPAVGAPSERSLQLFDMCSYDMDSFKDFIRAPGFRGVFDLDDIEINTLLEDEEKRLHFSFRFLKQVLFGEETIPVKEGARERRAAERKGVWKDRREKEVAKHREDFESQKYGDSQQSQGKKRHG